MSDTVLAAFLVVAVVAVVVLKWRVVFKIVVIMMLALLVYGIVAVLHDAAVMTGTQQATDSTYQASEA
jgi:hypothetical protein